MPLRLANTKYFNKKTEVDGIIFDSAKEARRYEDLSERQYAGDIRDLRRQVRYDLVVNGVKIGFYKADFVYVDGETGQTIVEDVKPARRRDRSGRLVRAPSNWTVYRIKKKLMKALHGIDVIEV